MSHDNIWKNTLTEKILKIENKVDYANKLKEKVEETLAHQRQAIINGSKSGLLLDKEKSGKLQQASVPANIQKQSSLHMYKLSIDSIQANLKTIDDELNTLRSVHEKLITQLLDKKKILEQHLESIEILDKNVEELEETIYHAQRRHEEEIGVLQKERDLLKDETGGSPVEIETKIDELDGKINEKEREHEAEIREMTAKLRDMKSGMSSDLEHIISGQDEELTAQMNKLEEIKVRANPSAKMKVENQSRDVLTHMDEYHHIMGLPGMSIQDKRKRILELRGLRITPSGRVQMEATGRLLSMDVAKYQGLLDGIDDSILMAPGSSSESSLTESSIASSASTTSGMSSSDTHYLKTMLGKPLTLALADIAAKQPRDPIHFLGHWLFKYRYNQETDEIKKRELEELIAERKRLALIELRKRAEEEARQTLMDLLGRMELEVERRAIEAELRRIEEEAAAQAAEHEEMQYEAQDTLGIYDGPVVGQKL